MLHKKNKYLNESELDAPTDDVDGWMDKFAAQRVSTVVVVGGVMNNKNDVMKYDEIMLI